MNIMNHLKDSFGENGTTGLLLSHNPVKVSRLRLRQQENFKIKLQETSISAIRNNTFDMTTD